MTELAVVLVIVALLLGGMLIPMTAQIDIRDKQAAERSLAEIREVLIGFALQNGRLPCPASQTIVTGAAGAGLEETTGSGASLECACTTAGSGVAGDTATACTATSVTGVLPWATLGFPEIDTWGNRYTYRMTTRFGRGIDPARATSDFDCATAPDSAPQNAAFALCTEGKIEILATSGGVQIASDIPAVVVSHGKTAAGAWTTQGVQLSGATGDESENADGDITFVSRSDLDDVLVWLPSFLLSNRMVAAGKLP